MHGVSASFTDDTVFQAPRGERLRGFAAFGGGNYSEQVCLCLHRMVVDFSISRRAIQGSLSQQRGRIFQIEFLFLSNHLNVAPIDGQQL